MGYSVSPFSWRVLKLICFLFQMCIWEPHVNLCTAEERLGSESVRASGSGPAQGLCLVRVFSLLPLLSKDPYIEEKWAISKPKKPLRAWTRANLWTSSSIIHKNDLFFNVESRKILFILQRSAKLFGWREDLWTRQSSLRDESRSFWRLRPLRRVCTCVPAPVAVCEGTSPLERRLNRAEGGQNNHRRGFGLLHQQNSGGGQ